jgi:hypothetical protein
MISPEICVPELRYGSGRIYKALIRYTKGEAQGSRIRVWRVAQLGIAIKPSHRLVVRSRDDATLDVGADPGKGCGDEIAVGKNDHPAGIEKHSTTSNPHLRCAISTTDARHDTAIPGRITEGAARGAHVTRSADALTHDSGNTHLRRRRRISKNGSSRRSQGLPLGSAPVRAEPSFGARDAGSYSRKGAARLNQPAGPR